MPALTRRIDPDVAQETWRIHFGDVVVGSIAAGVGNPSAAPKWQWRLRVLSGPALAAAFDQARAGLRSRMAHVRCEAHRG
jgi:hypothetical protein